MKSILLLFFMLFYTVHSFATVTFLTGSGSSKDPYIINNIDELKWMRNQINQSTNAYTTAYYRLNADLDLSDEDDWLPVGEYYYNPFKGTFDGNNKAIRNIKMGSKQAPADIFCGGLFGYIENATIINLGVEWSGLYANGISSYSLEPVLGGIVGNSCESNIINCYSTGEFVLSSFHTISVGGIVGKVHSTNISSCYSTCNISCSGNSPMRGSAYFGGIMGVGGNSFISNCYSTGSVFAVSTENSYSGGIVGCGLIMNIINSYSSGDVSSSGSLLNGDFDSCSGGIIGMCQDGLISNCYSTAPILSSSSSSSRSYSGGIAGLYKDGNINNCIALNSRVIAINPSDGECMVGRITGNILNHASTNYASRDLFLGTGTSTDNITPITDISGDNNGQELVSSPIILLNKYVADHVCSDKGFLLYAWQVNDDINNGFPVIDYLSPMLSFNLKGAGDPDNPYLIYTNRELFEVAVFINTYPSYSTKYYQLMSDLDLSAEPDWTPIGTVSINAFKGIFDGNNKKIRNLKIGSEEELSNLSYSGFFGCIKNARVNNLGVEWLGMYCTSAAGGIAGSAENSKVDNCYSKGRIYSFSEFHDSNAGGIIGDCSKSYITNCYTDVALFSAYRAGGIVGFLCNSNITNCYSVGSITATHPTHYQSYAGGIAGQSVSGHITNCYSAGSVYSFAPRSYSYAGGIAGNSAYPTEWVNYCISLNSSVVSISQLAVRNACATRIAYDNIQSVQNYADESVIVKSGTSETDLIDVETTGAFHGENLKDNPVDLLNHWVKENSTAGNRYFGWTSVDGVNGGYPVFGDYPLFTVGFETNGGTTVESIEVEYGQPITRPIDPIHEDHSFEDWYKDAAYTELWDFDADCIYRNTTLYAKWNGASSIESTNGEEINVYSMDGTIVVKYATTPITVYHVSGAIVQMIQQPHMEEYIDVAPGYYVISVGNFNIKVAVK